MTTARPTTVPAGRRRTAVYTALILGGTLLVGCGIRARLRRPAPVPPVDLVATAWAATLDSARAALTDGRAARADSVLTAFRDRYVGMPQSAEALYWRALARLDLPPSPAGVRPALADLDAYGAAPRPEHAAEAAAFRRVIAQLDSVRAPPAPLAAERPQVVQPTTHGTLALRDSLRARDEELQRARADAVAARAELDRVRRRLAAPGRRP